MLFTFAAAVYVFIEWIRRKSLPDGERAAEDFRRQAEHDGLTELMESAASGDAKRIGELIAYGANVNAQSSIGSTALMYAARNNHTEIVKLLLASGADSQIRTLKGSTAAKIAAKAGNTDMSALLAGKNSRLK